jgi:phosphatidylserine/phosphatidylglycerophosphate/cardiolipin synthase-like enzyme
LRLWLIAKLAALMLLAAWAGVAFWNAVKPLPPGTRAMSLPARLAESDLEFVRAAPQQAVLGRALSLVEHAEQLIVIDQSPLAREIAQALLLRRHLRPHLKIVVIVDPSPVAHGGTPAQDLQSLERQGIIVARVRLERLRDSNPIYSALWRLGFGWWSDPFEEAANPQGIAARARQLNAKADQRQMLVADDGSGGWVSMTGAPESATALVARGALAQDIMAAELSLASWSDEDRLPAVPPAHGRGLGTIDARFLTEAAIAAAMLETMAALKAGDAIFLATHQLSDRDVIAALLLAASRGAEVQVLLDPLPDPNLGSAGELHRNRIEVRWAADQPRAARSSMLLVRHGNDASIYFGSANFTRRNLADLNLECAMELRAPASGALPGSFNEYFARRWAAAAQYPRYADESAATYWSFRLAEATGLSSF